MAIPEIITIDGPAASGKSTLGHKLAQALGYLYFDTGVMYRAVTWMALQQGLDIDDEAAITALAQQTQIDVLPLHRRWTCLYRYGRWAGYYLGYPPAGSGGECLTRVRISGRTPGFVSSAAPYRQAR